MTLWTDLKISIEQKIKTFSSGDSYSNAVNLLNCLGYHSEKKFKLEPNTPENFLHTYDVRNIINSEKALIDSWQSVDFIFQLTEDELSSQNDLFKTDKFKIEEYQSYLFFAIELKTGDYSRRKFVSITREINKLFLMPVLIIFKVGDNLTFSIINRRPHKREISKDVLEKVTLIKDINIQKPHHAHIEILSDLSYSQLYSIHSIKNFLELHDAWQKTLDSSELNKKFFKEIANWYFWAVKKVEFPADGEPKKEAQNAISVICLITRLIFVWFLKEKHLVPEKLFNESEIDNILNKIDQTGSTYYKAILQNLFLATLNTEMNKDKPDSRKFVERSDYKNHSQQHLMPAFRYERFFKNPVEAQQLFENIPFLNGGLFENLDYEKIENEVRHIIRIDCFSDNPKNETLLKVPDELFFGGEKQVDLSDDFGDQKGRKEIVRGIIHTLNRYKFTVEENTPIEEEIALDPELLGKVFENLLASYNPETHTTARKQTGSFYTPREIVNFMVDESLIAYLENSLMELNDNQKAKLNGDQKAELNRKLHQLISYNDLPHSFNNQEVDALIKAIDHVNILDPACGSGAFPMGILHKLVFVLNKLDPHNKKWKDEQIAKVQRMIDTASEITDFDRRQEIISDLEKQIASIEDAFANNELDYGRKLYLIENCIYGVDIQAIAVQIAKLRFFISLMIDQRVDPAKKNLNIRPLPNLETKFVAANTLIGLEKPAQTKLRNLKIEQLENELKAVRQQHFNARTRDEKKRYRNKDEQLRHQIAELLIGDGWNDKAAHQIADWDPYNQNSSSDYFDPEWMFGVDKGFDVVIGNPPYIQLQWEKGKLANLYGNNGFKTFTRTGDIYCLFYEKANHLLRMNGITSFITSNKWMRAAYGEKLRKYFAQETQPLLLLDLGPGVFEAATVDTNILLFAKRQPASGFLGCILKNNVERSFEDFIKKNSSTIPIPLDGKIWEIRSSLQQSIAEKIRKNGTPLREWKIKIIFGIKIGYNPAFIIDNATKNKLITSDSKSAEIIKPLLRGRDTGRYTFRFSDNWLIATFPTLKLRIDDYSAVRDYLKSFGRRLEQNGQKGCRKKTNHKWFETQDNIAFYKEFEKEKIVWKRIGSIMRFSYDMSGAFCLDSTCIATGEKMKFLVGLLNSKLCLYELFRISPKTGTGDQIISVQALEPLCVPRPNPAQEKAITELVDKILKLKQQDHNADSSALENEIDLMVYKLYGLNYAEVKIVDPQFEMSEAEYNNLHFDFQNAVLE